MSTYRLRHGQEHYNIMYRLSLAKLSDLFMFMNDHKKLPLKTYGTNLKLYLENIISKADVTLGDLNCATDTLHESIN